MSSYCQLQPTELRVLLTKNTKCQKRLIIQPTGSMKPAVSTPAKGFFDKQYLANGIFL
jgi:hypothetical protein